MMMVVWIVTTLQSILMKKIFSGWIKAARVNRLRHVKVLGWSGTIWYWRRRVHRIQIRISHSHCRWVWYVVNYSWRWARELATPSGVSCLNVACVWNFSLGSTCWKEVSKLRFVATVGSWRRCCQTIGVNARWGRAVWSYEQLICFREVSRRETCV